VLNFISKIKSGLRDPKKGLEYLLLGEKNYNTLHNLSTHSCFTIQNTESPLESHMIQPTDIHEHLQTLYMLTVELNLNNILELGTRTGESTIALLLAAKELGGKMTSVDIDPCNEAKEKVRKLGLDPYWNFIQGDDLKLSWKEQIDHLFIDTSHTYEHTMLEFKKFEPFVRKGGLITLHDIVSHPPVLSAINDFISERNDIRFYKFFHNNGLGILRKT
jgi:predicted O-methyltransferase YrrM